MIAQNTMIVIVSLLAGALVSAGGLCERKKEKFQDNGLHCIALRTYLGPHTSNLLSTNLQSLINEKLMPCDLMKMKITDKNWSGNGIFEEITPVEGLFAHKETNEIIFETKEKHWTEKEIINVLGYEFTNQCDEFKTLIQTKNWNGLFFRQWGNSKFENYWRETLADVLDVKTKYEHGETVIMRAVMKNYDTKIVEILLKRGVEVDAHNTLDGWTALHWAVHHDNIEAIKFLLKFNAEINAIDEGKRTPLMQAVRMVNVDAVKVLMEYGADVGMRDYENETALGVALGMRDYENVGLGYFVAENEKIIKLLKQHPNLKFKEK